MKDLEAELKQIKAMANADQYEEAFRGLDVLAAAFPREAEIWIIRAYVNRRQRNLEAAIADWSTAIGLCDKEPHYFYIRGLNHFGLRHFKQAVSDFTQALELCDFHNSDYYREATYFVRADAYLRLGEFDKARSDCAHVQDGSKTWTDKLRTKEDILAECA